MRFVLAVGIALVAHMVLLLAMSRVEQRVVVKSEPVPFEFVENEVKNLPSPPGGEGQGEEPAKPRARFQLRGALPEPVATDEVVMLSALEPSAEIAAMLGSALDAETVDLSPQPAPASQGTQKVSALVHARLAAAAERCYPAAAKRFRQRGTVTLSFCGDADAAIVDGEVTTSSGAALLDAAATDCVLTQASPLPIEAARSCFTVPVRFGAQ